MSLQSRDTPCATHPSGDRRGTRLGLPQGLPSLTVALSVNSRISQLGGELFLRQLPVTTDPGARLLEVVSRLGGATSHATPSFTSARLREPRFQPLRGSPQLARLPTAEASNADRQRVNAVRCARNSRMNAQTPASVFNGPEHWRQRAEEARRMADLMSDIPSKEAMLRIAEDYEHLAEWAEERAKRSA